MLYVALILLVVGFPFAVVDIVRSYYAYFTYGIKWSELKKFNSGMEWLKGENPKAYAKVKAMPKRNQFDAYNAYQKKLVLFDDDNDDKKESRHYRGEDSRPRYKNGHRSNRSKGKKKVYYED